MTLTGVHLRAGNLPAPLTGLVGRRRELSMAASRLQETRLVTIVGTGGCGKTRLALQLAASQAELYPGGAWWVELAVVEGSGLVAQTVASALGISQTAGSDPFATIANDLSGERALLVLDNCEHLAQECADLVAGLLRATATLTVLATSRQPLVVPGEALIRLSGLEFDTGAGDGTRSEAAALLVERARSVAPTFTDTGQEAEIDRLCALLDGLPLAIELAAARLNALRVAEIIDRLGSDERLLRHSGGSVPPRQRTLRSTLDWSHQFLQTDGRALMSRLAAFQGSFSLLAAEAVGECPAVDHEAVIDVLCRLVDKSLVQAEDRGGERRYRLLDSVRRYYAQKLAESGEQEEAEEAHAHFYLNLAHQALAGLDGPDQANWLDRLEVEHDNLRAVLGRQLVEGRETGGLLAGWMWPFWYRRGYYPEARRWLEMALVAADGMSPVARASVLTGSGTLAFLQCEYEVAKERLERALELQEEIGDRIGVASVLLRLGSIAREQGHYAESRSLHEQSLEIYRSLGDDNGVASCLDYLSFSAWLSGDFQRACELAGEAMSRWDSGGRRQEMAAALINLAAAMYYSGRVTEAAGHLEDALEVSRELRYQEGIAWATNILALTRDEEQVPIALGELAEALAIHHSLGDRWRVASVLEAFAARVSRSDATLAGRLYAAATSIRERLGAPLPPAEQADWEDGMTSVREALTAPQLEEAMGRGAALSLDDVVGEVTRFAAGLASGPVPDAAPAVTIPAALPGLTEREVDVLRLVARGLSNRQIAADLFISPSTAGVHVSNILHKLGVTTRVQAAGIAYQAGIADEP